MKNSNLHKAKIEKNDEFYSQLTDIEKELKHYKEHFKGKVVFCNCDDPEWSNFWKYFELNFDFLGLKKLVSTHFEKDKGSYKLEIIGDINGDGKVTNKDIIRTPLKQNGDFRSDESIEILKECDIVVTNPPFSCYSSDTEVFTNNGWKLFKDVLQTDLILSMNIETKETKYTKIIDTFAQKHVGKMYNFSNRYFDLFVTGNHRMIVDDKFKNAEDITPDNTCPRKGFEYVDGEHSDFFILPEITQKEQYSRKDVLIQEKFIPMNNWLEFFGFWLADGCIRLSKNSQGSNRYTVSIKQNEKNEDYVVNLFKNIGFECNIEKNKTGNNNYTVYSKQLWSYLLQFGKSQDKYIPSELLILPKDQLKFLLKGITNGDSYGNIKQFYYGSVSKKLIDNISELLLKVDGILVSPVKTKSIYKGENYDYYKISFSKQNLSANNFKYGRPEIIDYNDFIYCFTLEENNTMLVRRNGKSAWCGNCFRDFISLLAEYDKKFLVVGSMNAITYKECFKLIKENRMWLGMNYIKEFVKPDGTTQKFGNINWFTNLEHEKRNEELILYRNYNETDYPKYDNYDAINVDKTKDIPCDYFGAIGVPISFLDKYNPKQFEVIGISANGQVESNLKIGDYKTYNNPFLGSRKVYQRLFIKRK